GHFLAQLERGLGFGAALGVGLLELGIQRRQRLHAARDLGRIRAGGAGVLGVGAVVGVVVLVASAVAVVRLGGFGLLARRGRGGRLRLLPVVEADHDLGQALLAGLVQLEVLEQQLHRPGERSEERRVGKEGRGGWWACHRRKKVTYVSW